MTSVFIYRTVPTYYAQLRSRVAKVGRKKIKTYQDDVHSRVGFSDGMDIYCISVATIRDYYNATYAGELATKREAKMYVRDMESILNVKDKKLN